MLIEKVDCGLSELRPRDAKDLNDLMVVNALRFERFFPHTLGQNLTLKASRGFIDKKVIENRGKTEFTYAIRSKINQKVAGLIILKEIDWNKKEGELAYCIGKEFEGRGWTTQLVMEFSRYVFATHGLTALHIIAHLSNQSSIRVAEKCGFVWQETLFAEFTPPKEIPLDMELYTLRC